jgi:hypothetical protein
MWIKRIYNNKFKLELGDGESIIFDSVEDIHEYWKTKYRFPGYVEDKNSYPFKKGDIVIIPKGTYIKTTGGRPDGPAGKTYKVKIDHFISGCYYEDSSYGYRIDNPIVRWAGTGGYWHDVDINDILEANNK